MTSGRVLATVALLTLSAASACSGNGASGAADGKSGSGTISGAVAGNRWTAIAAAYWIGKPGAGSPPTILFLLEAPTTCAAISTFNWDKIIGNEQVLEFGIKATGPGTFPVVMQSAAAYLRGSYNPDADGGSVTISAVDPGMDVKGSFDLHFAADALKGTFDAVLCPDGVEP